MGWWLVVAAVCAPTGASAGEQLVVQQIGGAVSGDMAAGIARELTVVPFSEQLDARTMAMLIGPGRLSLQEDGTLGGLDPGEQAAVRAAFGAGQTIVIPDASLHDIEALHQLVGAGVTYRSSTDPVVHAYTLRQEGGVPTARLLTYSHLTQRLEGPERLALAVSQAVGTVVGDLRRPPAPPVSGPPVGDTTNWSANPVQTTYLTSSDKGSWTTTVNVYALHQCTGPGDDHYVVTTLADWTPTDARFESARFSDGTLKLNNQQDLDIQWQPDQLQHNCTLGSNIFEGDPRICRYIEYPLDYDITMEPPSFPKPPDNQEPAVLQLNASPAATQGTSSTYTAGFAFEIQGGVNISGSGPEAGFQASATWSNETSTTVPPLLIDASNPGGGQGVDWKFRYCTAGSDAASGQCVSHVQMAPPNPDTFLSVCVNYRMGDPQHGQTPNGKFSDATQTVYWRALPSTRQDPSRQTFDITVTFTASLANSTETRLWWTEFDQIPPKHGPIGYCNVFGCSCSNATEEIPVKLTYTFQVPFPSTVCGN